MKEIWKDICGYEGQYQVSNMGNVRSVDRVITRRDGRKVRYSGKVRKQTRTADGYLQVQICPDSSTTVTVKVHRLVADAFVNRPVGMNEVNHIDENKENNRADNLEWSNRMENCNHGTRNERIARANGRPVMVGWMLFPSYTAAAEYLGVTSQSVSDAVAHGYKCRGYTVRRANND